MSEKTLWINLRKKMIPQYWSEATRHEDAYQRGIADVSFVQRDKGLSLNECTLPSLVTGRHGFVELKFRGMAPIRQSTACKIPHYTDDQRKWLMSKGKAGGMTFLLLQLGRSFMLFDHVTCQDVGLITTKQLRDTANWISNDGLDARGLWEAINESG